MYRSLACLTLICSLGCSSDNKSTADARPPTDGPQDAVTDGAEGDGIRRDQGLDHSPVDDAQVGPTNIACSAGWCWENPLPVGDDLNAVWALNATEVFVAGSAGTVLRYDGNQWHREATPTTEALNALWGSDGHLYAVGDDGVALERRAGGWVAMASGTGHDLNDLWGVSPTQLFAVGENGTLLEYQGQFWARKQGADSHLHLEGVWAASAAEVYAVGGTQTLLRYDGTAISSEQIAVYLPRAIWGSSPSDLYVGGRRSSSRPDSPLLIHFDGTAWNETALEAPYDINAIYGTGADDVFVAGHYRFSARYDGTSWGVLGLEGGGAATSLRGIFKRAGGAAWVVGENALAQRFESGWQHLLPDAESSTRLVYGFWGMAGERPTVAFGQYGTILRWQGDRWLAEGTGDSSHLQGAWGASATDFYLVGASSTSGIVRHVVGAQVYEVDLSALEQVASVRPLSAIWGSSADDVIAVGAQGEILRFDGTQWSRDAATEVTSDLNAIWGTSASNVYVAGDDQTLLHHDGSAWSKIAIGAQSDLRAIWGSSASDIYVAGSDVWRFDGTAWRRLLFEHGGYHQVLWGRSASDVWLGASNGRLYHYDGSGWQSVETGRSASIYAIWGSSDQLFLGGSDGMVLAEEMP